MAYTRRQELKCTEAQMLAKPNVVLRDGEVIYITMNDGTVRQKMGDGVTRIVDLEFTQVFDGTVEQTTGNSASKTMSQKAITIEFGKSVGFGGQLNASHDLNEIKKPGMYYYIASQTPHNAPNTGTTCGLIVFNGTGSESASVAVSQLVSCGEGKLYYRNLLTSGFTAWKNIATDSEKDFLFRGQIKSDTDLNDLRTAGMYYYAKTSVPANAPTTNTAQVTVFNGTGSLTTSNASFQIVTALKGKMWYRTWASGAWSDWIDMAWESDNRWNTRSEVYGIQFSTSDETGSCTRVGDADGKTPDNFDNIYPWSDMRLCNVKIVNGKKHITYEGESAFTRDGSNGNVMVEIPSFYVCRERIGTIERWLISGEAKGGFELHPWFKNTDGSTVSHRYYGAYKATEDMAQYGVFSHSGVTPFALDTDVTDKRFPSDFTDMVEGYGYSRNTIYALSAIQYLFAIEYGTINSQSIFNGVTYCPYFSGTSSYLKAQNIGEKTNTFKLIKFTGTYGNSFGLLGAGMQVCVGGASTDQFANKRNIVSVVTEGNYFYVTVDGDPVTVTDSTYCFPIPQDTGWTDGIAKKSGAVETLNPKVAPFKYRHIENVWGNIWEALDGIRIVNGKYYLSDKNHYHDATVDNWVILGYDAPLKSAKDAAFDNRITKMGLDNDMRCITLPSNLFPNVPSDMTYERIATMYFGGDAYYSVDTMPTDKVYMPYFGGGWDHHENAGLFCMRFLVAEADKSWLYGERITL